MGNKKIDNIYIEINNTKNIIVDIWGYDGDCAKEHARGCTSVSGKDRTGFIIHIPTYLKKNKNNPPPYVPLYVHTVIKTRCRSHKIDNIKKRINGTKI